MSKTRAKAAALYAFLSLASAGNSHAAPCADVWPTVVHAFADYKGAISEDSQLQLQTLSPCAKLHTFCVVAVRPGQTQYEIVSGETVEALEVKGRGRVAVSGTAIVRTQKYRDVCLLVRYSGGSAAAWLTKAWATGAKSSVRLNTDNVQINGDAFSPSDIMKSAIARVAKIK